MNALNIKDLGQPSEQDFIAECVKVIESECVGVICRYERHPDGISMRIDVVIVRIHDGAVLAAVEGKRLNGTIGDKQCANYIRFSEMYKVPWFPMTNQDELGRLIREVKGLFKSIKLGPKVLAFWDVPSRAKYRLIGTMLDRLQNDFPRHTTQPYHPSEVTVLINEMLYESGFTIKTTSAILTDRVEIAEFMRLFYGYRYDITVWDLHHDPRVKEYCAQHDFKCLTQEEIDEDMRKFDLVITNPPYSNGNSKSKPLYPAFIELAVKNLKNNGRVVAISPLSENGEGRTKNHSKFVYDRLVGDAEDVTSWFNVGAVIKAYNLVKQPYRDWQPAPIELLHPERRRLKLTMLAVPEHSKTPIKDGIKFPYTIHKDGIEWRWVTKAVYKQTSKKASRAPWLVIVHDKLVMNYGQPQPLNNAILENDSAHPMIWGWCYAIDCATKAEAERVKALLDSPEALQWLSNRLKARGALHTLAKRDFEMLPWIE